MNKYQEALDNIWEELEFRSCYEEDLKTLQELVYKATILSDDNIKRLLKNFIPVEDPYCSNCMFFTESDCTSKNCYLNKIIKALELGEKND